MSARPRPELTIAELEEMAGHVLYERRMWQWALDCLIVERGPSAEHNALIEVYNLHSRTLTDFLACDPKRNTDIVASDFGNWRPGGDIVFLLEAVGSINKRLLHISTWRLNKSTVPQELERWSRNAHHLTVLWDQFLRALSPERRIWFEKPMSAS
jgi:hypothetical protein